MMEGLPAIRIKSRLTLPRTPFLDSFWVADRPGANLLRPRRATILSNSGTLSQLISGRRRGVPYHWAG
jgi:hypothetical protein